MGEKKTLLLVSNELMDGAVLCEVLLCNCEHYRPCWYIQSPQLQSLSKQQTGNEKVASL